MGQFRLFIILSLVISHWSFAEVRYVSHSGSSTPPYLSWETAADSIMSAVNISSFGDTIYVANGVYEEQVVMIPGLSLIGAGMDSCIIDMTNRTNYVTAVEMKDSCLLEGFNIKFCYICPPGVRGLGINMDFYQDTVKGCIVRYNKIDYPDNGVWVTEGIIRNNIIIQANEAIDCATLDEQNDYVAFLDSNFISFYDKGIYVLERTKVEARNNVFLNEGLNNPDGRVVFNDFLSENTYTIFENNNILKSTNDVVFERCISNAYPGNFTNNQFLTKYENVFYTAPADIKNNNIINSLNGVYGDTTNIKYNNFWKVSNYPQDTTNISADPMFENEDSLNFHLQMYSPLINAGDPDILDKDGSRSDIGLFGGPYGEKYTYRDLAPKPPSNLAATYDSGLVLLRWDRNTEADFYRYRVYRDTAENFTYDSTRMIAETADTFYYDDLPEKYLAKNYYYKLTATDTAGHQSAPSEEVQVNITGVPEGPPRVVENYQLLNNYPNPFNSGTIIPYRIKEGGYVKLYIYDIKGELVRVLVNEYQSAGYYEVRFSPTGAERKQGETGEGWWTGYNDDIATGIYLYQIIVRGDGNVPVFTDMGKMILLK